MNTTFFFTCGGAAWKLSPPDNWSGPVGPGDWVANSPQEGLVDPVLGTGWAGISGTGASYFDGTTWFPPVNLIAPTHLGIESLMRIGFVKGITTDGWAATQLGELAELDTTTYPAPGRWVVGTPIVNIFGVFMNPPVLPDTADLWAVGYGPAVYHSTTAGSLPTPSPLPAPPAPLNDPLAFPSLFDVTFYSPDPNIGIAVGGAITRSIGQEGGAIIYVTSDRGQSWQFVSLVTPAGLDNVVLLRVRFVDQHTAYAIASARVIATDTGTSLLVKITR